MKRILALSLSIVESLFGRIHWSPPVWLRGIVQKAISWPLITIAVLSTVVLCIVGVLYFQSLPQPITVIASATPPELTQNYLGAKPAPLSIEFDYDLEKLHEDQQGPEGEPSVARIDLIGKLITEGISISPSLQGRWQWVNDRTLQFTPEHDWAPSVEYAIQFEPSLFANGTKLSENTYVFTTHTLGVDVSDLSFYQDPKDAKIRRVIATLNFTHPIDADSLKRVLHLGMRPSESGVNSALETVDYSIKLEENMRSAYVQSAPISLPEKENYLTLRVDSGLESILGGMKSKTETSQKLSIPDIYSYLKVESAEISIIRNEKDQPEQVLTLTFTDDIDESIVAENIQLYLLSGEYKDKKDIVFSKDFQKKNTRLKLSQIANPRSHAKSFSYIVEAPENQRIYLRVNKGITSINNFVYNTVYEDSFWAPQYPREIKITGEGSILTHSGSKQLSTLSRGVSALRFSVGRLLEGQINHLVSQTSGDITNPYFNNWYMDARNLAEYQEKIVLLRPEHPKTANYASLDLSEYMKEGADKFGLFFIEAYGYDPVNKRDFYEAPAQRLVLVTDLGLIVKDNADGSHEVFVQSIQSGKPVANAKVELLGKNGVALFTEYTSKDGHVSLPVTHGLQNEKQPVVYVVKSNRDVSFIPFDRHSRQINLSKFDIGGVNQNSSTRRELNGFGFTDRGIYRPGEKINVGFIVKNSDLSSVDTIPLELVVRNPRNNDIDVKRITLPELGMMEYSLQTDSSSDTGHYTVSLHIIQGNGRRGRQIGSTYFKLEEFQADTMKISSELLGTKKLAWSSADSIDAKVSLKNLFGLPAQDRKVEARLMIQPSKFVFKKYEGYTFTPLLNDTNAAPLNIDEYLPQKSTDADGHAQFTIDLDRFREGTYSLQFNVEGFDQSGGRSVSARNSVLISPLAYLVGFKADGKLSYISQNSKRSLNFLAVDQSLKGISKDRLSLRKLEIQHVSTLVKQRNGSFQYQTVDKENQLSLDTYSISEDGEVLALDTSEPGDFALEIYDENQRRLARAEYSVVGFGNLSGKLDKNAELQLKLEKTDYKSGDEIKMSIKAPYVGAGLITIESDKVHQYKWFKTDTHSTEQSITLPEGIEGSAYVNVAFVRDVGSKEIFTSPLSYAVQPFSIDKSKRKIDIELGVAPLVRPGKSMEIAYSTNIPAKIVVFAVDEGILQVSNYSVPKPLDHYLKKRALGVNTLQILDLILPEFNLVRELSAAGGGAFASRAALAKNLNPFARKVDAPAVYWSGIVEAGPKSQSLRFEVPDTFAGSLRVMAVAVSDQGFGTQSKNTLVRGPFVLSPNVLTQAAPGDEFYATVGVANIIEGSGKQAAVDISINVSEHLELLDGSKRSIKIDEGSEGKATFHLRVNNSLGAANIQFNAQHQDIDSSRSSGLSIRPAMPYQSTSVSAYEADGKIEIPITRTVYSALANQYVSASTSPLVLVDGLKDYLEYFPHGCTEQVVSQVFPLIGLMSHPAYGVDKTEVYEHFDHLIAKLRERQQADGSFSFWPGGGASAHYPSIYATHFLIEAKTQGFSVPTELLERAKYYLNDFARLQSQSLDQARERANAIYLLTRLGDVTTNHLVELHESLNKNHKNAWRKELVASYMAATYSLLKKTKEADELIQGFEVGKRNKSELGDFNSPLTQDAQHIYLLAKHFPRQAKALASDDIMSFVDPIFKGEYNTLSAAYSILALGAYSELTLNEPLDSSIRFSMQNLVDKRVELNKTPLIGTEQAFAKAEYDTNASQINIEAEAGVFYLNTQNGFDISSPKAAVSDGIEIYREFLDDEGNSVTEVRQGQELTVRLRIRALNDQYLTNIAVVDLMPGGFEIIRSSVERTAYDWLADYVDIREDRIIYYGDFDKTVRDLVYKVKATSAGSFVVPSSFAGSMYRRDIKAISASGNIIVSPSVQ